MKQSTMEAFAEVDIILNLMDEKYIKEIPNELRSMFKEKKTKEYTKNILVNKPLEDQNLNRETLLILAVLNYNYWCKDELEKKELLKMYLKNEEEYEEKLREKYNPDNIFKRKIEKTENINEENKKIIKYSEFKWYKKLFVKIISILKNKKQK